jgi:hypothetical protein
VEIAYRDAEKQGIPEIEGYSGKVDFLNTAVEIMPAWADRMRHDIQIG